MAEERDPVEILDAQIAAAEGRYKLAMVQVGEGLVAAQRAEAEVGRLRVLRSEFAGESGEQPALFDAHGRQVKVAMGPASP